MPDRRRMKDLSPGRGALGLWNLRQWGLVSALRGGIASVLLVSCAGCMSGSLATSTGDRAGGQWSIAPRQRAHVGEAVDFSFVLKDPWRTESVNALGLADYCVFRIGDQRFEAELDDVGGFRMTHTFSHVEAGDTRTVRATAFRERGDRDQMWIGGEWLKNESPHNPADEAVARGSVRLTFYQVELHMKLPQRTDDYDFSTARLAFRRADSPSAVVYPKRPPREGFEISPSGDDRSWWITYTPSGTQLNSYGETPVEFSIYDVAGRRHVFSETLTTP